MDRLKWILSANLLCTSLAVTGQTTLQSCIELAEKNNPQSALLPLVKEAEAIQVGILNKSYLPQLSLGGQATWQSAVTSFPIALPNISVPTIPRDQYKTTIDLTQYLWDGGLTKSQKRVATATATAESRSIENSLYQTKEQISNLYFGALLAEKQLLNTEIVRNDLESQQKKLKASVENGTAIRSNVMMIEARLIELKQQQREIVSRKLAAFQGLSILTGMQFSESTALVAPTLDLTNDFAINRPELIYFDAQQEVSEANKSLVRSKYAPKINLFGTGGYGRPGLNFLSPDFTTYFIGGVALKVPLTHFFTKAIDADIRQIDIGKAKIEKQRALFLQQTQLKLASQKEDLAKLQDQIKEDTRLIEIREYMKKTAEKRLENGVITLSDYISEVDSEAIAKQNLSLHQIQLLQIVNNIKITTGK